MKIVLVDLMSNRFVPLWGLVACATIAIFVVVDTWPPHVPPWSTWYGELLVFDKLRLLIVAVPALLLIPFFIRALFSTAR